MFRAGNNENGAYNMLDMVVSADYTGEKAL
jgi:hypothetical protein